MLLVALVKNASAKCSLIIYQNPQTRQASDFTAISPPDIFNKAQCNHVHTLDSLHEFWMRRMLSGSVGKKSGIADGILWTCPKRTRAGYDAHMTGSKTYPGADMRLIRGSKAKPGRMYPFMYGYAKGPQRCRTGSASRHRKWTKFRIRFLDPFRSSLYLRSGCVS